METRFLGRSGLEVSVFGFGTMTFGGVGHGAVMGETQVADGRRQIDMAIEAGVNLFDTADIYSVGAAEEILGEIVRDKRNDVLIATKAFSRTGEKTYDVGLSRRHLIEACEASLRRLKTDWIDLYQVHNFDTLTPLEETLRTLDDLVRAGKVRYIGCSNYFGWELTKALGVSERLGLERYISQQIQYSLIVRDAETEMLPAGIDQGVGALIWGPLASGYLTGKFRGELEGPARIAGTSRLAQYDDARGRAIVAVLDEIAKGREGVTPSQVAINWVRARPGVTSVILGARDEAQLRDNLAAATWSLSSEEMGMLERASRTPLPYPVGGRGFFHPERNPHPFRAAP